MKNKIICLFLLMIFALEVTACDNTEKEKITCTISIECGTILNNMKELGKEKVEFVPKDGIILEPVEVTVSEGTDVYELLTDICRESEILMESSFTAGTGSAYIEGIANLYEFDCGKLSGWEYSVNGEFPNVSCSDYKLKDGDVIEWRYTCNLGEDLK